VWSALPVIIIFPDGLNDTFDISPVCPSNSDIHVAVLTLYTLPVPSADAVANLVPNNFIFYLF
jgi:hypothetical protein